MKHTVVYGLTREDGKIFYVGKTANPRGRLLGHKWWFGQSNLELRILQDTFAADETPAAAERRWIKTLAPTGIVNVRNGGLARRREGKKALITSVSPEVSKQVKQIALDTDQSIQGVVAEALNELFQKYKKPTIA